MDMQVRDGLPGVPSAINDDAVAALEHAELRGDLPGGQKERAQKSGVVRLRLPEAGNDALRDNEDVDGRLGIHVPEGEVVRSFQHDLRGNLPSGYFFKNGHIERTHSPRLPHKETSRVGEPGSPFA